MRQGLARGQLIEVLDALSLLLNDVANSSPFDRAVLGRVDLLNLKLGLVALLNEVLVQNLRTLSC